MQRILFHYECYIYLIVQFATDVNRNSHSNIPATVEIRNPIFTLNSIIFILS